MGDASPSFPFTKMVICALALFYALFLVQMGDTNSNYDYNKMVGSSTLLELPTLSVSPKTKDVITAKNLSTRITTTTASLFPLPDLIQYSHRPVNHLENMKNVSITPWMLPRLDFLFHQDQENYLIGMKRITTLQTYLSHFEGSVTHTWLSILHKLPQPVQAYMIIDGGMNIGFYTTISAVSGYKVHSFDIQLDCFDITNVLLRGNHVKDRVNFYHLGLWSDVSSLKNVMEGCDPGRNLDNVSVEIPNFPWSARTHTVGTVTLDTLLETTSEQVAILKMDIEGAEISALKGISTRHLARIENILMECALQRMHRLKTSTTATIAEFQRLQEAGFRAYLLYQPSIPVTEMWNPEYLETTGIRNTPGSVHPLLKKMVTNATKSFTNAMQWEVVSWNKLLTKSCSIACNLWFSRMVE